VKISIIIPLYNVETYVTKCLESVASQDWDGNMECIIINDCSSDSSLEITEHFVASYSGPIKFCILHHRKNNGLSAARNTGIEASTGDYLFFLDSDDYISSDCLRLLSAPLKEKSYDIVVGNYLTTTNHNTSNKIPAGEYGPEMIALGFCSGKYHMAVWNKLYNKQSLAMYGIVFKDDLLFEDVLFSSEVSSVFKSMFVIEKATYYYSVRTGSMINSFDFNRHSIHYQTSLAEYTKFAYNNNLVNDDKRIRTILRFLFRQCIYGPYYSFAEYLKHLKGFFRRYLTARTIMDRPPLYFTKADGLDLFHQIQDFHFILHPFLGAVCYLVLNIVAFSGVKWMISLTRYLTAPHNSCQI